MINKIIEILLICHDNSTVPQTVDPLYSPKLIATRWFWTETFENGIEKIKDDKFAFIETTLSMQHYLGSTS